MKNCKYCEHFKSTSNGFGKCSELKAEFSDEHYYKGDKEDFLVIDEYSDMRTNEVDFRVKESFGCIKFKTGIDHNFK